MKKLRKEVKIFIGVMILVSILILDHAYTERIITRCINSGVEPQVCEELR